MSDRCERLQALLPDAGIDLLLVSELVNVRYLTGYSGSNGLALLGAGMRSFVTDYRYVEQAAAEVDRAFERVRASQDLVESLADLLPEGRLRLGFDDRHMSVHEHRRLRELLDVRVELIASGGLVERLREVKEAGEIERIAAACALADAAFESLVRGGLVGRTERQLAIALEHQMRRLGAEGPSFDSIVAGGPHGALPHAQPREVAVERGDLVVIDWGARLDGYCSDCTRTVAAGEPGAEARAAYELVRQAQLAGVQAVTAGAGGREVDAQARAIIEAGGEGEHFGHGLGHGVGLEIHEAPRLSQRSEDELAAGNVVTVEPGIYLPGRFGIRIEDLLVVLQDGARILTSIGKDLILSD
ncbi:MAG: M24 family metallopeptidase [Solirubrobacteraceae bacterium]